MPMPRCEYRVMIQSLETENHWITITHSIHDSRKEAEQTCHDFKIKNLFNKQVGNVWIDHVHIYPHTLAPFRSIKDHD